MSSDIAIRARGLGKRYALFDRPVDRLKQMLFGRFHRYYQEFWALQNIDMEIRKGEVVGIIGRNGAGKSTLLQLVCSTLQPTTGELTVEGRVAALLELGAGFNSNFTGRENVYLNAAILGMSRDEIAARIDEIIAFADIGDFIDQPVKIYSSGMFMRLAFAVATSVDPDILVIDEALSVGDGAFARKSFDRIMKMKDAGKTILFCSHSTYQVEALCSRALWIEHGALRMTGSAADVTNAYHSSLAPPVAGNGATLRGAPVAAGNGRIVRVTASADGVSGKSVRVRSGKSDVAITIAFAIDPALPAPTVALGFADSSGLTVASATSLNDGATVKVGADGYGEATVVFPRFPLLKGKYSVTSFLACENAIHVYEQIECSVTLEVVQEGLEQGLVSLPHEWRT